MNVVGDLGDFLIILEDMMWRINTCEKPTVNPELPS